MVHTYFHGHNGARHEFLPFYKPAHASSSSGVSQSFDRAASLNNMVSGICEILRCFIHATKSTTRRYNLPEASLFRATKQHGLSFCFSSRENIA